MNVASIDIGTNTVLEMTAEVLEGPVIRIIDNQYSVPRLGEGLTPGGYIKLEKFEALLHILKSYKEHAESLGCEAFIITATNAMRVAANGREIVEMVKNETGLVIEIISGAREAELSYLGASFDYASDGFIAAIDIGGGSTEVTIGRGREIIHSHSYDTGAVALTERFVNEYPLGDEAANTMAADCRSVFSPLSSFREETSGAVAIGGTPVTLYALEKSITAFEEESFEGKPLQQEEIKGLNREMVKLQPVSILAKSPQIVKGREDVLPAGGIILATILELLGLQETVVTTKGLRYGQIVDFALKTFGTYSE